MGKTEKVLTKDLEKSQMIKLADSGSVEAIFKRKNGLNGKVSSVDIALW